MFGTKARVVLALALLAASLSFFKFSHCQSDGWSTPDQYVHACYSDIPALFGERGLDQGTWSYSSGNKSVEYPVITGAVMWATAKITPQGDSATNNYYLINIFFIALLFLALLILLARMSPHNWYLLAVAPAVIASLYINWDLWAIPTMLLAIYWFDRKRYELSAVALGISIATKFLPVFLLLPILLISLRTKNYKKFVQYFVISSATWLAINLPVYLTTPTGWLRFYELNLERSADWGSLWYAAQSLGINIPNVNLFSFLFLAGGLAALTYYIFFILEKTPRLSNLAFITFAIVAISSKVYSPQYILWLTPLAIIAISSIKPADRTFLTLFWSWQISELIYHLAIWQHLATVTGAKFGLPLTGYALITLLRIFVTAYFALYLAKRLKARTPLHA